ncbi:YveK family protein [Atopobiaceae bacterium HCP3S3_F7]|jgi:capsular polysaccharide biosynthesis protein|nr:hypothetical protein [Olsenella sp.]
MSLLSVLRLARRNLALVLVIPVAAALAIGAWSYTFLPDWYTSTATLAATTGGLSLTPSALRAASLVADDFAAMAEDPQTQNEVARSLGMADLDGYVVRVGIADNTRIITVSVTGVEPQVAADVANALADTFNQKAAMLQGRGRVSVVTDAQPPERASGPSRKAYVTAAFALTLAVVLAWLVAREMSQGKVDGGREVEDLLGKPVIGRVPTCR